MFGHVRSVLFDPVSQFGPIASDSQEASFLIKYHWGGVFVRDLLSYDYEILSEIPNVDLVSLGLASEQNDNCGSDLEDDDYNVYDYCSSEVSDTASVDHLSNDEEEVLDVRTKKRDPAPKKKASKMFDESFFTSIFNGLPKDDFDDSSDPKTDDQDKCKVRNEYEGFKVDERLRTCTCRGWQLIGIPCQHGLAALYFLHRKPEEYVSEWTQSKGLSIKSKERSAIDVVTLSTSTKGGTSSAKGSSASVRGGTGSARGGLTSARGGNTSARGGNTSARGGKTSTRGGLTSVMGGKTPTRGGKTAASSAPSSQYVGFEMSLSQGMRMTGSGIRIRGGVYITDGSQSGNSPNRTEARSATNEA
nr:transposase, Ptta/En/Spm [Tanacetum cinerariifolium]